MRTFPLILRVALLITSVGFVSMGCTPREHVRIVREIELSSQRVSPYVIIRAPGGGYVITGSNGFADAAGWAMRIDARGRKLWEVVDGDLAISGDTKASINRFNGAALLSGDKTLLCGTRLSGEGLIAGRVLVVTSDGTISSAKDLFPNIPGATSAYINKCLAWNDGVALVGTFSRGMASSGWLMKLDKAGSISGQIEIPCIQAFDVVETALWLAGHR